MTHCDIHSDTQIDPGPTETYLKIRKLVSKIRIFRKIFNKFIAIQRAMKTCFGVETKVFDNSKTLMENKFCISNI